MKKFDVCLEMKVLKTYSVEAMNETYAIETARLLAEQEDGTAEVTGGHAEEAEPVTA